MMDIVEEAKKASVVVYLVTEESVAADLSEILNGLVAEIERLREIEWELTKETEGAKMRPQTSTTAKR